MIEVFFLPKRLRRFLGIEPTSLDFERFYERQEIAGWLCAFCEEMKVVRHEAVGVDCEIFGTGFGVKGVDQPLADFRIREYSLAPMAADGYEVEPLALVAGLIQPDWFFKMRDR